MQAVLLGAVIGSEAPVVSLWVPDRGLAAAVALMGEFPNTLVRNAIAALASWYRNVGHTPTGDREWAR